MTPDIQMFQHGFFPASFNKPKMVFTFRVLNDFLLDNLECSTLAMNYYSKLRQMTLSMFPHLVPDRYRELMRLKTMKWHGFGHHSNHPNAGDLTLFCLACPQPGMNVSFWKYTRSFVMDGNFKAKHLHPINPCDKYKKHLAEAADTVEKLSCNNHQAAQHNMEGITRAVTFYDVNCQYNKHFQLWHVHGHQDSCYVRYASNFIEGIGWINREIMETLWACLNLISPAARGMSSPH
ncbi:hypothetical protein EDB19DRAFT_1896646 [Suillus lakei]|nr:hypothetical protein EDB19DRAFT_1896646 [Suillus lakei]